MTKPTPGQHPESTLNNRLRPSSREPTRFLLTLLPFLLLAATVFLVYEERIRNNHALLIDSEPYLQARIARSFSQRGIITRDHLLAGGMEVPFTPYKALVILFSFITTDQAAALLAPLLLAVLALACLNRLLTQIGRPFHERCISLSILVLTPIFIHDTLITGARMATISFQLAFATLLLDTRQAFRASGIAAGMLASSFSPLAALETIILGMLLLWGRHHSFGWISAMVFFSILGAGFIPPDYQTPLSDDSPSLPFTLQPIANTFSELGSLDGLATFTILLGIIGLWIVWPRKAASAAIIGLSVGSILDPRLLSSTNIVLACLSGATVSFLQERSWRIKDLKHFALLVIACGILFSAVSATVRISSLGPSAGLTQDLQWLLGHSRSGEVVLSMPQNGHWIQYYAVRPVVLDPRSPVPRIKEAEKIFSTYNLNTATSYLRSTNTSYIVITTDMLRKEPWAQPGQGLHYLLANPETFKKVYGSANTEIYEYLQKPYPRRT